MQDVADACKTGAATDIIFGLALGYKSAIIPCLVIAVCIFVSFTLAHMFGIACAALGMLTTLSTGMQLYVSYVMSHHTIFGHPSSVFFHKLSTDV